MIKANNKNWIRLVIGLAIVQQLYMSAAFAGQSIFRKEVNLIGGYSDNREWVGKTPMLTNSIGFEDFRKFSNDYGDFLTTDLQVRVAYDSLEDSRDAWGVEVHNAWLEYKLGYGYNLKVGHFDPAFGLEPVLDTHSTILQTLLPGTLGFKKDWGVEIEGSLPKFDYAAALQLGSGMSIRLKDDSFLLTARIGSPGTEDLRYGASALYGNVLESSGMKTFPANDLLSDEAQLKKRVGIDAMYDFGPYRLLGEVAYGRDEDLDVLGYMAELDYTIPGVENLQLQLQIMSWINDLDRSGRDDTSITAGLSYRINSDMTVRTAYVHDLNLDAGREDDAVFLQFYYYGS